MACWRSHPNIKIGIVLRSDVPIPNVATSICQLHGFDFDMRRYCISIDQRADSMVENEIWTSVTGTASWNEVVGHLPQIFFSYMHYFFIYIHYHIYIHTYIYTIYIYVYIYIYTYISVTTDMSPTGDLLVTLKAKFDFLQGVLLEADTQSLSFTFFRTELNIYMCIYIYRQTHIQKMMYVCMHVM